MQYTGIKDLALVKLRQHLRQGAYNYKHLVIIHAQDRVNEAVNVIILVEEIRNSNSYLEFLFVSYKKLHKRKQSSFCIFFP